MLFCSFNKEDWSKAEFLKYKQNLEAYQSDISINGESLKEIKSFLVTKRNFFLRLLENPNLFEHESFTGMLWALFHLVEELDYRESVENLQDKDLEHIAGDIKRAYKLIVIVWLNYMQHLKKHYPYLFSLALRTNPFDKNARISAM